MSVIIILVAMYVCACLKVGAEPGAPLWLSWPTPILDRIDRAWQRPKPDYAKIRRLERELGIRE